MELNLYKRIFRMNFIKAIQLPHNALILLVTVISKSCGFPLYHPHISSIKPEKHNKMKNIGFLLIFSIFFIFKNNRVKILFIRLDYGLDIFVYTKKYAVGYVGDKTTLCQKIK